MTPKKLDAFISYSHADCGNIAPEIQKGIEHIGKPWFKIGRNLNVFRDETNLAASPQLWLSIEKALNNSANFILLASPIAAKSKWINEEVSFWIEKFYDSRNGLQNLYIVLTDGTIAWDEKTNDFDWEKTDCLPKILSGKFSFEPLWIDLKDYIRQDVKKQKIIDFRAAGFTRQVTKIIGGITGRYPRDIESDELQRSNNIKRFLGALSLVLIGLLVMSVVFFINEKAARNDAQLKQQLAEKNLKDFEIEKFQRDIRNGNIYHDATEFCFAKACYLAADSTAKKYPADSIISGNKVFLQNRVDSCSKLCP